MYEYVCMYVSVYICTCMHTSYCLSKFQNLVFQNGSVSPSLCGLEPILNNVVLRPISHLLDCQTQKWIEGLFCQLRPQIKASQRKWAIGVDSVDLYFSKNASFVLLPFPFLLCLIRTCSLLPCFLHQLMWQS